jgi:hypothetical protein
MIFSYHGRPRSRGRADDVIWIGTVRDPKNEYDSLTILPLAALPAAAADIAISHPHYYTSMKVIEDIPNEYGQLGEEDRSVEPMIAYRYDKYLNELDLLE